MRDVKKELGSVVEQYWQHGGGCVPAALYASSMHVSTIENHDTSYFICFKRLLARKIINPLDRIYIYIFQNNVQKLSQNCSIKISKTYSKEGIFPPLTQHF